MATTTPNFGWPVPTSTDLVKDGATAMEALGDAIDTSMVDLKGGTTGQVLAKASNTDMDFSWVAQDDSNAIQNTIVDAKGDLIAASAADTPARLAVGSNGETLVADSSTATGLRYQAPKTNNVIINGDLDIWQRGTSFTSVATAAYLADRWSASYAGTTINLTVTQDTSVPNANAKYSMKFQQVTTGATSVTEYVTRQTIEQSNLLPLLGKACVLSFWYKSNKTGTHGLRIIGTPNTGGTDQGTSFTVSVADTWEYKTVAITAFSAVSAPSAAPTSAGGYVDIGFKAGNTGAGFTTLSANDYFQVSQIQLEIGNVATPFARAGGTIQGELAACQRYYIRYSADASNAYSILAPQAYTASTTVLHSIFPLPVELRTNTAAVETGGTVQYVDFAGGSGNMTTPTVAAAQQNTKLAFISWTVSGATAGRGAYVRANNSTTAYIGLSAEL